MAELGRQGIGVASFTLGQPSLDEVFLALTDRPAAGSATPDVSSASKEAVA